MSKVYAFLCISEYKHDFGFGLPDTAGVCLTFSEKLTIIKIYKQDMKTTFMQ